MFAVCLDRDLYGLLSTLFDVIPPVFYIYPPNLFDASSAWIGKDFADLLAFSIAMRCLSLCKYGKEGSYVAFFSFSNISLLNGMSYGRT